MTELAHPDRLAKIEAMRREGIDPYPPRGVQATPVDTLREGAGSADAPVKNIRDNVDYGTSKRSITCRAAGTCRLYLGLQARPYLPRLGESV